jgi:hypothetical protein
VTTPSIPERRATAGITDADERLHPVEDASPHWSDSLYFNAWDPTTNTFLMTRIAVQANAGAVTAGIVVWRDGVPVYAHGHELTEIPPTDWDVMVVGSITYRMLSAGRSWAVQVADGEDQAHLEWHGLGDAVSYDAHPAGPLPRAVAWGHYEQTCRVAGDLVVGGQRIRFEGFGQRDHSWGFRHWAGLHQWHWVTGFLSDGRGFNLFEVQSHQDVTTINGFVQGIAGSEYIVAADRALVRSADGGAERCRLTLATADGGALTVTAERAGGSIPVRPAGDQLVVVHETPMRLTASDADGVTVDGYGIYEHLVTEFD